MPKTWSKTDAFAHFGVKLRNTRWSWSGRSDDGKTVVMTFWKDAFSNDPKPMTYNTFGRKTDMWTDKLGNHERLENLKWARDHCDGLMRVVITVAEDTNAEPRSIRSCHPQENLLMRLVALDEQTGEFSAELVR